MPGHANRFSPRQDLAGRNVIEHLLDNKFPMMEWRQVSAKKMYNISQECLKKKKERPCMETVLEMLLCLYQ